MDCDRHVRVDRHRQKAFELGSFFIRILRVLDLNMFESTPISALLGKLQVGPEIGQDPVQQTLFPTLGHE